MRILLLSAFDAQSHHYWHQGLVAAMPQHDWTVLTLPARHFAWRFRGNALSFLSQYSTQLQQHYDVLLLTSMVDLVTLRGLVPALAQTPALVYFHENQFAYPHNSRQHSSVELQLTSLYTALSGQQLLFNSAFNRDSFLSGVQVLLKKLPERFPDGLLRALKARSTVLPVPLTNASSERVKGSDRESDRIQLLWNHRWEYDKGPERLAALVDQLLVSDLAFRLHIVGQQFRSQPPEFARLADVLRQTDKLGEYGFIADSNAYRQLLASSDFVLSTAIHDFQGLSVLEAVAQGASPCVPDRLAYAEWLPSSARYASYPDDIEREAQAVVNLLRSTRPMARDEAAALINPLLWSALAADYKAALNRCQHLEVDASWAE